VYIKRRRGREGGGKCKLSREENYKLEREKGVR
jgi:hypothetical protein